LHLIVVFPLKIAKRGRSGWAENKRKKLIAFHKGACRLSTITSTEFARNVLQAKKKALLDSLGARWEWT